VDEWLSARADALAQTAGVERVRLELSRDDVKTLLDLAAFAAHESGQRTNAPLLCYLAGLARGSGTSLDELADAVR
jgi:Domain of unknown function (DUF6457)